ncbi:MAG: hypothetical protein RL235_65, partial [Chlamydiota bacterium]
MNKKLGGIFLVAGTCIGSGMIALPMVLAKLGLIPSLMLMAVIWFITYYTSLVHLELNLQASEGLSLAELGRRFSGKRAEYTGMMSLKLLSYALLAVFIYGGASVVQKLCSAKLGIDLSFQAVAFGYAAGALLLLLLSIRVIDYLNRALFIGLIGIVACLIVGLIGSLHWTSLPLFGARASDPAAWLAIIPVVFTSFGFQVIFHTLTNYCDKNGPLLKQVFFWGSLIPALVYVFWTSGVLGVVHHDQPALYQQMVDGTADVGTLIAGLGSLAKTESMELLIWWISLLAIATSV